MSRQYEESAELSGGNPPVLYVPSSEVPWTNRYTMPASFASQLLASRERMTVSRYEDMSPAHLASNAYLKGGKIAVKRMPNGYVRTLVV